MKRRNKVRVDAAGVSGNSERTASRRTRMCRKAARIGDACIEHDARKAVSRARMRDEETARRELCRQIHQALRMSPHCDFLSQRHAFELPAQRWTWANSLPKRSFDSIQCSSNFTTTSPIHFERYKGYCNFGSLELYDRCRLILYLQDRHRRLPLQGG